MRAAASWTAYAEAEGLIIDAPLRESKYHAIPVHVDGVRFASKKEAARYLELRLLEKAGLIADLECQPVFPLHVMEIWRSGAPIVVTTVGRFTADFRYTDLGVYAVGEIVVEDVKSEVTKTTDYKLRKAIAEHIHGIYVREV